MSRIHMFTGIIQQLGHVESLSGHSLKIGVRHLKLKNGDSVAVNGVCLTVSRLNRGKNGETLIQFDLSEETMSKTTLGRLKAGGHLNLETPLTLSAFVGGHLVTGHIDGVGHVKKLVPKRHSTEVWFSASKDLLKHIASKGCVAVDGVSLTVVDVSRKGFNVSLVPYTLGHTSLGLKKLGDPVNIETDILAKYVEKLTNHTLTQ